MKMSQIKIGWASRDVSTTAPINIPGQFHMRISKGILDPVTANALVIDNGEDQAIFLSCDLVVIRSGLLDLVREKTAALNPEIPVMKILMNATHTHEGPSHYVDKVHPFDYGMEVASSDDYREFLAASCAEAINEAWAGRAAGSYAYGYGYAVVAHSRRVCYFDDVSKRPGAVINSTHGVNGTSVMYGNTNDDNFSHYEAGADHFVNLLYTFDAEGKLTGAIVNVPCPSQNSEHEWYLSADYWHNVREAIRAKHGNIYILAQCAAAGDLSPRILHYKQAQARRFQLKYEDCEANSPAVNKTELYARKDIAERIAAAFDEVLSWAKKDIRTEAKVSHNVSTVQLDKYRITEDDLEYAKDGLATSKAQDFVVTDDPLNDLYHNTRIISNRNRFLNVLKRYEDQKTETTLPMELHVLRIGDIAFASNRFELYMDFQHRIQARSPFEQTFIVQLAGPGSYLCTDRAFEARGYSAIVFSIQASPKGGQDLVEETVKQLKELYAEE